MFDLRWISPKESCKKAGEGAEKKHRKQSEVVFNYAPVQKDIRSILKFTGAEGELDGTTLTLTAKEGSTQINLYAECWDGVTKATFSNRSGCSLSKSGTLYAKNDATAKMTIDGVEYTVVFDFEETPVEVDILSLLSVKNAYSIEADGNDIELKVEEGKQINIYPTLKNGDKVTFTNLEDYAKVSKNGTLYSKKWGGAEFTYKGETYSIWISVHGGIK